MYYFFRESLLSSFVLRCSLLVSVCGSKKRIARPKSSPRSKGQRKQETRDKHNARVGDIVRRQATLGSGPRTGLANQGKQGLPAHTSFYMDQFTMFFARLRRASMSGQGRRRRAICNTSHPWYLDSRLLPMVGVPSTPRRHSFCPPLSVSRVCSGCVPASARPIAFWE